MRTNIPTIKSAAKKILVSYDLKYTGAVVTDIERLVFTILATDPHATLESIISAYLNLCGLRQAQFAIDPVDLTRQDHERLVKVKKPSARRKPVGRPRKTSAVKKPVTKTKLQSKSTGKSAF
jgi:hypothetical protein